MTLVTWGAMTIETLRAARRARQARHQRRGHRSCDLEPDRHRDHSRVGGEDRPAGDRARGGAQRRRRRGDCGARRGARPVRFAGAHPARRRIRHRHAAVQARARLHSERAANRRCGANSPSPTRGMHHEHIQASGFGRGLGRGRDPRVARQGGRSRAGRSADGLGGNRESRGRGARALQRRGDRPARRAPATSSPPARRSSSSIPAPSSAACRRPATKNSWSR